MKPVNNPYVWHRVDLATFFGRRDLLDTITRDLLSGRSVGLIGGRKIGKTMLMRKLERELRENGTSQLPIVPVYVDTLSISAPLSQQGLYSTIISAIDEAFNSVGLIEQQTTCAERLSTTTALDFAVFRATLSAVLADVRREKHVRLVILFDEVEPIVVNDWGAGFFSNWRSLLSNTPDISPFVSVLFSGAKEMGALSEDVGSPIANILIPRILKPLSWPEVQQLVAIPTNNSLPRSVARELFRLTGGHPFLCQYLLHHVSDYDASEAEARLGEARDTFFSAEAGQFANWWERHFSRDERTLYMHLQRSEGRVGRGHIVALFGSSAGNGGLETLETFGVIRSNVADEFRPNGILFQEWVNRFSPTDSADALCDRNIHERLQAMDPDIAKKYATAWAIYNSSLDNYSGAVGEIRDVVTLTLHLLAPDKDVESQPSFEPEKDNDGKKLKPTRRQRVDYIVRQSRSSSRNRLDEQLALLDTLVEQLGACVSQSYAHASARTHKTATREQAWRCLKQLDSVLAQIL